MGILSFYRNLLSKFKPNSISSSDVCFFRRTCSPAAVPPGTINLQQALAPTIHGDLNRKSMFLIEHQNKEKISNYSLLSSENNNNSWKCSPFPGRPAPGKYNVVSGCKELILFWSKEKDEFVHSDLYLVDKDGHSHKQKQRRLYLWNPATMRVQTLPPSLLPRPRRIHFIDIYCFGFGYDPISNDYKLLCFLQYDSRHFSLIPTPPPDVNIELYSLKTDSWKRITAPPDVVSPYFQLLSIHINGVHYWARNCILSFDFGDEKFSHIPLPNAVPDIRRKLSDYCLAEFHESLALIVPYWVPAADLTEEEKLKQMKQPFSVAIWVWNGKTWELAPGVAVGDFPVGDKIDRLLGLFHNEFLFLQGCNDPELMLFNCKTGKLEKLGIEHDPSRLTFPAARPGIFPFTVPI